MATQEENPPPTATPPPPPKPQIKSKPPPKIPKACNLDESIINLNVLREDSRNQLLEILDKAGDDICLVIDEELSGLMDHILTDGTSVLRKHGVKDLQEFSATKTLATQCQKIVYLVRPVVRTMRIIAAQIKGFLGVQRNRRAPSVSSKDARVSLFFVPKRTLVCEEILKREGVFGSINIGEYALDFIPFDYDVLSLELNDCFRKMYLENDKTHLHAIASSIQKLQVIYGTIPNVKFKGDMSKIVYQMMLRSRLEQEAAGGSSVLDPEIDTIVLLDRPVDLISVLVTPLTYEALLNEFFGIKNGCIEVDADLLADPDEDPPERNENGDPQQISLPLNSNDKLFADVRDFNVETIGFHLQQQAKDIRERYDEFRQNKDASISEIREFVKRIPGLKQTYQSLTNNINLAEFIKNKTSEKDFIDLWMTERSMLEGDTMCDKIEEMMGNQDPLTKILRLICLQSITNGGLKSKNFDHLRRLLLQTYGFEMLLVLNRFEKLGMLKRRDTLWAESSPFSVARKGMRLINDNVNVRDPRDIAYVTSGYAPLSVRLIEAAMKPMGWKAYDEVMRQLPGESAELSQVKASSRDKMNGTSNEGFGQGERKVMVVYFIGGVTFMEISAIRFLAKQQDCPFDIIVATTKLISGNTMLSSFIDKENDDMLTQN